jgi:transcriptional regulator GlxA family with amidase domain
MKQTIAILLFADVEELDFVGPWEVFAAIHSHSPDLCDVYTVSETGQELRCAKGLRVRPDHNFATAPPADVLIVPGGQGRKVQVSNPRLVEYIAAHARLAAITASVCTGAFLLHKAGLLAGRRVTTYWSAKDELRALGGVTVCNDRWVDDGAIVTAAGVSAGIDMSLHLVGRLWGRDVMLGTQKGIEYYPAPPT